MSFFRRTLLNGRQLPKPGTGAGVVAAPPSHKDAVSLSLYDLAWGSLRRPQVLPGGPSAGTEGRAPKRPKPCPGFFSTSAIGAALWSSGRRKEKDFTTRRTSRGARSCAPLCHVLSLRAEANHDAGRYPRSYTRSRRRSTTPLAAISVASAHSPHSSNVGIGSACWAETVSCAVSQPEIAHTL